MRVVTVRGVFKPRLVGEGRGLGVSTNGTPKRAARFLRFSSSSSARVESSAAGSVVGITAGTVAGADLFVEGACGKLNLWG